MKARIYEGAVHRPEPHILVGFTAEDDSYAIRMMAESREYVTHLDVGQDGLTDGDRLKVAYARKVIFNWRGILDRYVEADTEKCKEILREEIERAFAECKRRERLNYKG